MSAKRNEIRGGRTDSPGSPAETASCALAVKAIPNAPRSEVIGWLGDSLKVKIHAPPVEGRANEALCEFLADKLDLPRRNVTVLRGDTSRQKVVRIAGLTLAHVKERLGL
jgi:uncharacterized protein (TIGR00251 family)